MKRTLIVPPKPELIIPESVQRADPAQPVGRVSMGIGGDTCTADLCSALSIASRKVGDEDALVVAMRAPHSALALYQPFDMAEAREFASAILEACATIEAASKLKQEEGDA